MGDLKRFRRKYQTPAHPWNKVRLDIERELERTYGLKSKKEQWKMTSLLKRYKDQAKKLITNTTPQGKKEMQQMMEKLIRLGLLKLGAGVDDILSLTVKDVMERRLQTILYRKGLAHTQKQARQLIVHRHVAIGSTERTFPSYLVSVEEEPLIAFRSRSALANPAHPERPQEQQKIHAEAAEIKKTPAKIDQPVESGEVAEPAEEIPVDDQ